MLSLVIISEDRIGLLHNPVTNYYLLITELLSKLPPGLRSLDISTSGELKNLQFIHCWYELGGISLLFGSLPGTGDYELVRAAFLSGDLTHCFFCLGHFLKAFLYILFSSLFICSPLGLFRVYFSNVEIKSTVVFT